MIAARDAIERVDFAMASNLFIGPAYSAKPEALFLLAFIYFSSAHLDIRESTHWLEPGAALHHAVALFHCLPCTILALPARSSRRSIAPYSTKQPNSARCKPKLTRVVIMQQARGLS